MADSIRVADGNRWTYVSANSEYIGHIRQLVALNMAYISNGSVVLRAEAGPIFWDKLKNYDYPDQGMRVQKMAAVLQALDSNSLHLRTGERISFGKMSGAVYNNSVDISFDHVASDAPSVSVSTEPLVEGQFVMTLWPENKRLLPAKIVQCNPRLAAELVDSVPAGERCFVLDDSGSLITISFRANGSDKIMIMSQNVVESWLCRAGSSISGGKTSRFSISHGAGGCFIISDSKTGHLYAGKLSARTNTEEFEFEKLFLDRLATKGLGAILPRYSLRRVQA